MHRYDKYDGKVGGFRAPLADPWLIAGITLAVGLNGSGQVVPGEGSTGIIGVLLVDAPKPAGAIVDVMTAGEVADYADYENGDSDPTSPGEVVSGADSDGILQSGTDVAGRTVGFVVQTNGYNRLVVRMGGVTSAA